MNISDLGFGIHISVPPFFFPLPPKEHFMPQRTEAELVHLIALNEKTLADQRKELETVRAQNTQRAVIVKALRDTAHALEKDQYAMITQIDHIYENYSVRRKAEVHGPGPAGPMSLKITLDRY